MDNRQLHITNGSSLTSYLRELDFKGLIISWQEMLCEGPTLVQIKSRNFIKKRTKFLKEKYEVEFDEFEFLAELNKLDNVDLYDEIILWFEYDLFCHINLLGVINLILQKEIDKPLYLVCSGRIKGMHDLKGLSELSPEQLFDHYDKRVRLNDKDIELARNLWHIYCGTDHNLFKPHIVQKSSFTYMGSCLRAHLERFPDSKNGLSALERNAFEILINQEIKSKNHLLGYAMNYQGFYGFGDLQMKRIIDTLDPFIYEVDGLLKLNRRGHEILMNRLNFLDFVSNNIAFGGVNRLDFHYSRSRNKLIKPIVNAH